MCGYLIDDALMRPILVDYLGRMKNATYLAREKLNSGIMIG
jgi:hypothetical protein